MRPFYTPSFLLTFISVVFLFSCRPVIYYIGDKYSTTSEVYVYYEAREIIKEYKVIGRMTKPVTLLKERDKY